MIRTKNRIFYFYYHIYLDYCFRILYYYVSSAMNQWFVGKYSQKMSELKSQISVFIRTTL